MIRITRVGEQEGEAIAAAVQARADELLATGVKSVECCYQDENGTVRSATDGSVGD